MTIMQETSPTPAERTRRSIFASPQAGLAAAAALGITLTAAGRADAAPGFTDVDIFNFALNFEYLGANYYLYAVTGSGLPSSMTSGAPNGGAGGTVAGGQVLMAPGSTLVPFTDSPNAYFAQQLAVDEMAHVNFIRGVLGSKAVAQPVIDLSAFSAVGALAGIPNFNPYADEVSFLLGAYLLEDTCVTALAGAAALVTDKVNLQYAAGLLGVESQQAGAIRGFLAQFGQDVETDKISLLRSNLSGVGDEGTGDQGNPYNISNGDDQAQAFRRTPAQVLAIAYGGPGMKAGGVFPDGVSYSNADFASS